MSLPVCLSHINTMSLFLLLSPHIITYNKPLAKPPPATYNHISIPLKPSTKMVDQTTTFQDLPEETIAMNIFTRLPVKTLIRSTSVCKKWYSNITKPSFFSAHIQHSLSCCNNNAVLVVPMDLQYCKSSTLISAKTGDILKKYKVPFKTKNGSLNLCGSFNGILCLNEIDMGKVSGSRIVEDYQELYVWNPSLGKFRTLFSSCFKKRGGCSYALGMGVYEGSFDFRLVRVVYPEGFLSGEVLGKVEVFSLKRNSWRRIKDSVVPRVVYNCGITVGNNMVYWLDTMGSKSFYDDGWIVWFDFNEEVFGEVKMPKDVRYCLDLMANFKLMVFEGKLAVCVTSIRETNGKRSQPCCIWLMSHEHGKISWDLRFKVVLNERARPLSISRSGTLLMVAPTGLDEGLVSTDLLSEELRQSKPLVTEPGCVDATFLDSLFMLEDQEKQWKSA